LISGAFRKFAFFMKRILLLLVLLVVVIVICFVPVKKEVIIKINASYFNCYQQLSIAGNWEKWQPDIADTYHNTPALCKIDTVLKGFNVIIPGVSYFVKHPYSNVLTVSRQLHNDILNYSFTLVPGVSGLTTIIVVAFDTNIISSILPGITAVKINKTGIGNFKKFMETPALYYGFDIRSVVINPTNVIVRKNTVLKSQLYKSIAEMTQQLLQYVADNKLVTTGSYLTQFKTKQADSVQILTGIAITLPVKANGDFIYMNIPASKALAANFKGVYRDKQKIYMAMAAYLQDKFLHPKIAPLEVFKNQFPADGNDVVDFKLIYPIF
jgi:effector-binding domain-containing protein